MIDVISGTVGGRTGPDTALLLAAPDRGEPARVMIYSGQPIGERVVLGGPFVINSRAEITKAFADFQAGQFGAVPRQARLKYDR